MAVKLRLARAGAKKRPFYRIVAADSRSPRDGKFIDQLGHYDPTQNPALMRIDMEKLDRWLKVGAKPSQTIKELIRRAQAERDLAGSSG